MSLSTLLKELFGVTRDNVISIKFLRLNDLDGLSNAANTFHTIFSQAIINDHIKGELKIESIENGSIWMDIFVGTTQAYILIGCIAWSAAVVYKKIQEGRIIEEHVKTLKIKNESLEDMRKVYWFSVKWNFGLIK